MDISAYRFTKTHEWIAIRDGLAYVGISDHAQEEITDVVYVDLPAVGSSVAAGDELLLVDSVKSSFSIYAPVTGEIKLVNDALAAKPELINQFPYTDGWLVALDPTDPAAVKTLMTSDDYSAFLESER